VVINPQPDARLGVTPASLEFTPTNWNTPQTFSVTTSDDNLAQGDVVASLLFNAVSADPTYDNIGISDVEVTILDNDRPGVIISPTALTVSEDGLTNQYTVQLNTIPTEPVEIVATSDGQTELSANGSPFGTSVSLPFTSETWDTPQTVTVAAIDDGTDEPARNGEITHTATSADTKYDGMNVPTVFVFILNSQGQRLTYLPLVQGAELLPNLVASMTIEPSKAEYTAGEPVFITVTVTNTGLATTRDSFWVDLFINPQQPPTPDLLPITWNEACGLNPCLGLAWNITEPLAPQQSITLTSEVGSYDDEQTRWFGWFANGTTDLYLYVDTWDLEDVGGNTTGFPGNINESDENDNRFDVTGLTVTGTNPPLPPEPQFSLPPRREPAPEQE
jgi:hypothetical protein